MHQVRAGAVVESLEQRNLFAVGAPIGFGAAATGGGSGPTVTATTAAQFAAYATQSGPLNIQVQGTLDIGSVKPTSDKTIIGLGTNATLIGSVGLYSVGNVIVQNLFITNPNNAGEGDGITIKNGTHDVWVDHCTIYDTPTANSISRRARTWSPSPGASSITPPTAATTSRC
jgi:pectate lyase